MAGFWEFPSLDVDERMEYEEQITEHNKNISKILDIGNTNLEKYFSKYACKMERNFVGETSHVFSHIKQTLHVERVIVSAESSEFERFVSSGSSEEEKPRSKKLRAKAESDNKSRKFKWVTEEEMKQMAISKGTKKCFSLKPSASPKKQKKGQKRASKNTSKEPASKRQKKNLDKNQPTITSMFKKELK